MPIDPDLRERLMLDYALDALSDDCAALLLSTLDDGERLQLERDRELAAAARVALRAAAVAPPPWSVIRPSRHPLALVVAAAAATLVVGIVVSRRPLVRVGQPVATAATAPAVADFWAARSPFTSDFARRI